MESSTTTNWLLSAVTFSGLATGRHVQLEKNKHKHIFAKLKATNKLTTNISTVFFRKNTCGGLTIDVYKSHIYILGISVFIE